MKSFFGWITRLSLRFRAITILLATLIAILGIVGITHLRQELIPPIEVPQTVILSQVSGMTSDEVLTVLTARLEDALAQVPDVANLESTTTGSFGSVIIARNEFGLDQQRLQQALIDQINTVWLPLRRIAPAEGQDPQAFASGLLADMTPDVMLYLSSQDATFLFQLTPAVWDSLPEETVRTLLAYLAGQTEADSSAQSVLGRTVDQEIIPQLEALDVVAEISVSGGQVLPGDENQPSVTAAPVDGRAPKSRLLNLSPEVWAVLEGKFTDLGPQTAETATNLATQTVDVPTEPPALPESWQQDRFTDATDLVEMRTLTRSLAGVFNDLQESGEIVGALGQTNDLTPEIVTRMLELAPSMIDHFEADQLVALPDDVFAVLPEDYIAGLDGFTRDALAAASLAASLSGEDVAADPVPLPSAWRIQPPQLISFSFDDLPLATFSIFGQGTAEDTAQPTASNEPAPQVTPVPGASDQPAGQDSPPADGELPVGPPLPPVFALLGLQFGTPLDTADDLINLELPPNLADQMGGATTLRAADLLNFLLLLGNPDALPEGTASPIPIDPAAIIGALSPDVISYLAEYDPTFLPNLQAGVYDAFSTDVLSLPDLAPPLPDVWDTLASQPEFQSQPLRTTQDVLALDDGQASTVLNTLNATVPAQFSGYEVRLLDSLSTADMRYFALQEPDFYAHLDPAVLEKLSPEVLALLPDDVLAGLDTETADTLRAIASGDQPSAAATLADRYTSNVPPADPNAPPIGASWSAVANFYNIELDTADDFFRFPEDFSFATPADFMNSFFASAQGAAFAPSLFGGLTPEAATYMLDRDPSVFDNLAIEALQLLPEDVLAVLPAAVQDRAASSEEPFAPSATVTRLNGASSLLLTIYKTSDANTVEAFHTIKDTLDRIAADNPSIDIAVSFEQASFIEELISGVAREGGLGAVFAVVVILAFLSAGVWNRSHRQATSIVIIALGLLALLAILLPGMDAAGGDLGKAFAQADVLVRSLLIGLALAGLLMLVWPRNLPSPAWRSTLVTAASIPLSILMAMAIMNWIPPLFHNLLAPAADGSALMTFILRLFPSSVTINIMTLSGLTVAIGRVVDDSIVVLENIFREIQAGQDKREAIIAGTRDVSVAIFAATAITVVVFLPLGMTGGIIGAFFLPFGLAVTYALLSSFVVAITVVPTLAFIFVREDDIAEEKEGFLERLYRPVLRWSLSARSHQWTVLGVAAISMLIGVALFASRPAAFLPDFGEPQITVNIALPAGTRMLETNAVVSQFEDALAANFTPEDFPRVQTVIGSGGGLSIEALLGAGGGISENQAAITLGVESPSRLDALAGEVRTLAESVLGPDNVSVSAGSLSSQGFGGFALVLSGPQDELVAMNDEVIATIDSIDGITNVSSNLMDVGLGTDNGPITYIRVDSEFAVRYTAELETENSIGVTQEALDAVKAMPDLPDTLTVSQGFEFGASVPGLRQPVRGDGHRRADRDPDPDRHLPLGRALAAHHAQRDRRARGRGHRPDPDQPRAGHLGHDRHADADRHCGD